MNNDILLTNLTKVSESSESIADSIGIAKEALAALLTDKNRRDIYDDVSLLMEMLESIYQDANAITWKTEYVKRELKKEDHSTTK